MSVSRSRLWFGDERGYNATSNGDHTLPLCCGLVMKEDITQRRMVQHISTLSCGLVMKEDITQPFSTALLASNGCGLVMKEDITQLLSNKAPILTVVVW